MLRHHEEVSRTVPPERLLVWSVTEGWEPLCEFLAVPVPDMPFPRVNDSREFVDRIVGMAVGTSTSHQRVKPKDLFSLRLPDPGARICDEYRDVTEPMITLASRFPASVIGAAMV